MDLLKPWYLSRTIWASIVVILSTLAGMAGFEVNNGDVEALIDALLQAVAAVAGVAAIAGRMMASSRIG